MRNTDSVPRSGRYLVFIPHQHLLHVGDHEDPAARIDSERPRMHPVSIGVLNQRRFAGLLVDRINRNGVLAAAEYRLPWNSMVPLPRLPRYRKRPFG